MALLGKTARVLRLLFPGSGGWVLPEWSLSPRHLLQGSLQASLLSPSGQGGVPLPTSWHKPFCYCSCQAILLPHELPAAAPSPSCLALET